MECKMAPFFQKNKPKNRRSAMIRKPLGSDDFGKPQFIRQLWNRLTVRGRVSVPPGARRRATDDLAAPGRGRRRQPLPPTLLPVGSTPAPTKPPKAYSLKQLIIK
jgi:hypothetical protein